MYEPADRDVTPQLVDRLSVDEQPQARLAAGRGGGPDQLLDGLVRRLRADAVAAGSPDVHGDDPVTDPLVTAVP